MEITLATMYKPESIHLEPIMVGLLTIQGDFNWSACFLHVYGLIPVLQNKKTYKAHVG